MVILLLTRVNTSSLGTWYFKAALLAKKPLRHKHIGYHEKLMRTIHLSNDAEDEAMFVEHKK